jgi:uncharacterized protein (DUF1501 family)
MTPTCCDEYLTASRRTVLRGLVAGGLTATFGTSLVTFTARPAAAATGGAGTRADTSVIVVLSLRGAADGLSLMVPYADHGYYASRPSIAVPAAKLLHTDGHFGLHPSLAALDPLWKAGSVAAIHGTGMIRPNRSHFEAMEIVEDADLGSTARNGWLNRLIGDDADRSPLEGIAVGSTFPTSLYGPSPAMSFASLDEAQLAGEDPQDPWRRRSIAAQWGSTRGALGTAMGSMLTSVDALAAARTLPDTSARYPADDLGRALSTVARTIRSGVGVDVVTVDHSNWDDHVGLAWVLPDRTATLAASIAAFFTDLGADAGRVTLVTISEFGRRVVENSAAGLDHGWGNVMFAVGAGVKGGYYTRSWRALGTGLDSDVPVTIDYRDVLADVVAARSSASTAVVFPGLRRHSVGFMA